MSLILNISTNDLKPIISNVRFYKIKGLDEIQFQD